MWGSERLFVLIYKDWCRQARLRTRGESCRTSQQGPWLSWGWKSIVRQDEAKTEFIEDIESTGSDGLSGRLRKESSMNLIFIQGLDFFIEDSGLVYMSSQAPRKKDKIQLSIIRKLLLWSLASWHWDVYLQWFRYSLLCWKTPKISLTLSPLEGGHT